MTHLQKTGTIEEVIRIEGVNTPISFKEYQTIYHQITGKSEEISQSYYDNIRICFNDIEQMYFKIKQTLDIYKVIGYNEEITVLHIKEKKERFTSFDRFKLYNANSPSPTIGIQLKFTFSIVVPEVNIPHNYKLTVLLQSRVGMREKMRDEVGDIPPFIKFMFSETTCSIKVDYVDYVVARSLMEAAKEWYKSCEHSPTPYLLRVFKKYSHHSTSIFKILLGTVIISLAFNNIELIEAEDSNIQFAVRFILTYFGALIVLAPIAHVVARNIETTIDSYTPISYVNINKGDEKLIKNYRKSNTKLLVNFVFNITLTFFIGFMASKLAVLL